MSGEHKKFDGGKDRREKTMKKRHGVFFGFAVLMITAIFILTGCPNDGGSNDEPELAKWAGTWNSIYDYFDDPGLAATFQTMYDAIPDEYKSMFATSANALREAAKEGAIADFQSFVIKGETINFYDKKQTQKNAMGNVIETVTYTFKGVLQDAFIEMKGGTGWYAFEGNKDGSHKYLIFEEAKRENPDGPLLFHIRYGDTSFEDLLNNGSFVANPWYPTIISYDTTIEELQAFMLAED
jgi:Zn/Cd-binding protein ZinT